MGHGISNPMDEWRKRLADRMVDVGVTAAQLTRAAKVGADQSDLQGVAEKHPATVFLDLSKNALDALEISK